MKTPRLGRLLAVAGLAVLTACVTIRMQEYTRAVIVKGILIKAPRSVAAGALERARVVVDQMLLGRADIAPRMAQRNAALAIIPMGVFITALPEFAYLSGRNDSNGNAYDSFAVRGAGAIASQPVTATAEENLLRIPEDPFAEESIAHHEFAHAIMNLGFTARDRRRWTSIFSAATARRLFRGTYAVKNADEYWAELSQSWFSVNNEINGPGIIRQRDPEAAAFLEEIYGPIKD
jgi:hypothetical protein